MIKPAGDSEKALKLLDIYGGEADDFFKIWPRDKTFFFSSDKKAFVAYAIKLKVAVCLGDPVGARPSIEKLLSEFKIFCAQQKLLISFIQATDKYKDEYHSANLKSLLIGADAVINLKQFEKTTIHDKYFRNLVNRGDKLGFYLESYSPPHSKKLINELREVSDSWKTLPHRKEWSFLTGRFDSDYLSYTEIYVIRDKVGNAQAFTNSLPELKSKVITIDLMRHRADAPPNCIDFLFINLLKAKHTEGYAFFNLGISPLDAKPFIHSPTERLLNRAYKISDSFIGFRGLHRFKAKYLPHWEPRYIFYQSGTGHLIRIGLAVLGLLTG
jgi:phosphatidylglycerol lysyltransferase